MEKPNRRGFLKGGASNSPVTAKVTLIVKAATPVVSQVQSTGILLSTAAAPGAIITIRGSALAAAAASLNVSPPGFASIILAGTRVLFDDLPAPLTYVSGTQVNVIVPYRVAGKSTTRLRVESQEFCPRLSTFRWRILRRRSLH